MIVTVLAFGLLAILGQAYSQCPPDAFTCANGNCVDGAYICDGGNDCGDMSDERDQSGRCPACPSALHQCKNGRCTNPYWICDGDDDCRDGSDEADENGNCPDCPSAAFTCPTTGRCLAPGMTCDGYDHCGDWSDETEDACPCSTGMRCDKQDESGPPGTCIPPEWICDLIWDCPKGEDETNCTVSSDGGKHATNRRVRPVNLASRKAFKPKVKTAIKSKPHFWYKPIKQ